MKVESEVNNNRKSGGRGKYANSCTKIFFSKSGLVRLILTASLIVTAALVGAFSYVVISDLEQELGDDNYASVSRQLVDLTVESMGRMSASALTMALVYATQAPDAHQWPNVALSSFPAISNSLSERTAFSLMVYQPLVPPEKVASFEEFAYEFFYSNPAFYEGIGQHSFGKGIFAFDLSLNNSDKRYHDTTGYSHFSDRNAILVNFQYPDQTRFEYAPGTMYNSHSRAEYSAAQDLMLGCAEDAHAKKPNATGPGMFPTCPGATDILPVIVGTLADAKSELEISDAQFAVAHPIFPLNDATTIVGTVTTVVSLSELLDTVVTSYLTGLDVVFATDDVAYTFSFVNGKARFRGQGDKHDSKYSSYGLSQDLLGKEFLFASSSYTITVYPSTDYFDDYLTDLPLIAALVSVALIVFCWLLFIAYDRLMSWEFSKAQAVSETKRRFVRFISHEVRTPLNIVKLGLKIVEDECDKMLRCVREIQAREESNTIASKDFDQSIRCSSSYSSNNSSNISGIAAAFSAVKATSTTGALCEALSVILESLAVLREIAEELTSNTDSAVGVLDDLINYDKIEQGVMRLDCAEVNICDLLSSSIGSFRSQANTQKFTLLLQYKGEAVANFFDVDDISSLWMIGDAQRLSQVMRNLISNALKFTPAGGVISVSVECSEHGLQGEDLSQLKLEGKLPGHRVRAGSVIISVRDSGAGMTAAQLSKLFREGMQFSAKELQAGQGSGLGLFISKGLVEQHGGCISASSEGLGRGTSFSVEFPVFRSVEHPDRSAASISIVVTVPTRSFSSNDAPSNGGSGSINSRCIQYNGQNEDQGAELVPVAASDSHSLSYSFSALLSSRITPKPANRLVDAPSVGTKVAGAYLGPNRIAITASQDSNQSHVARASFATSATFSTSAKSDIFSSVVGLTKPTPSTQVAANNPTSNNNKQKYACSPPGLNILMVDDSLPNRKMLGRLLRTRGHNVIEACDGQQAVDVYKANIAAVAKYTPDICHMELTAAISTTKPDSVTSQVPPNQILRSFDCILMDFEMPIMNGPTAVFNIRSLGYQGPIIGVTGNVLPEDLNLFMKSGATAVLAKPVRIDDLELLWYPSHQEDE